MTIKVGAISEIYFYGNYFEVGIATKEAYFSACLEAVKTVKFLEYWPTSTLWKC